MTEATIENAMVGTRSCAIRFTSEPSASVGRALGACAKRRVRDMRSHARDDVETSSPHGRFALFATSACHVLWTSDRGQSAGDASSG